MKITRVGGALGIALLATAGALGASRGQSSAHRRLASDGKPPTLDLSAIDTSVNPCDDFYRFACGRWVDEFQLPGDKSSYYRQFSGLEDEADDQLRKILEAYSAGDLSLQSRYSHELGAYYMSCINEDAIEPASRAPLDAWIAKIDAITTPKGFAPLAGEMHRSGMAAFQSFYVGQDVNDSTKMIGYFNQGGMALPERDYYFNKDAKSVEIRAKYQEHIARMFVLLGQDAAKAAASAKTVLKIETALAKNAMTLAQQNDPSKRNHPVTRAQLATMMPGWDWTAYFAAIGLPESAPLNVNEPKFLQGAASVLKTQPLADLKTYARWNVLNGLGSTLGKRFEDERFDFWSRYLSGIKEQLPRWKRCVHRVAADMVEALGETYVAGLKDPGTIRDRVKTMVGDILGSFGRNLATLSWIDEPTRKAAGIKLSKVGNKVAYPEKWRSYDGLKMVPAEYLQNAVRANEFEFRRQLNKIGKPVDRTEWAMAPWEANAYFDWSMNEMVLPIGELLPPVFDLKVSDAANYGSLGASTIGHELTHGFDSGGSQYDENGNLKDWWSPAVKKEFQARAACFIQQAEAYPVGEGMKVKGEQTLTENLADQGGVKIGLLAYLKAREGKPEEPMFGQFNGKQQFFLAYAQAWCTKQTPESEREQLASNEHPISRFRVNAPLMNRPEFAEAFGCKTGSRMAPANRCSIW